MAELQRQGFETYEEVSVGYGDKRADVVAIRGPLVAVVETKRTMGLGLLNQLMGWRGRAHWIIGAVSAGRLDGAARRLCAVEGFGIWTVSSEDTIGEPLSPVLHRWVDRSVRQRCVEGNRSSQSPVAAGTNRGGFFTPFRGTARALAEVVATHPGINLRSALGAVKHHYRSSRSAISSLPGCIQRGIVPGVRMERQGKEIRLYPDVAHHG